MRKKRRLPPPNPALDLFGEVPVLESDIVDWVEAVSPRWLTPERSFNGYVSGYDVVGKIKAAKLAGVYEQIISRRSRVWHARLALEAIC